MAGAARRIPAPVRSPLSRSGRRLVAGVAVLLVVVGVAVAVADPFTGGSPAANGSADNAAATSLTTVKREDLSQQTQVSATLGYADASTIAVSAGTAPSNVQQAQQRRRRADPPLKAHGPALRPIVKRSTRRGRAAADRLKTRSTAAAKNAAGSASTPAGGSGGAASSDAVRNRHADDGADAQTVAADSAKVQADESARLPPRRRRSRPRTRVWRQPQSSAAVYGQTSVYTMLPKAGQIVRRGQALYGIGGEPVVLLYGGVTAWRAFLPGMSPGRDVAELNRNLHALGYGRGRPETHSPRRPRPRSGAFQSAHGIAQTGALLLGSVVFEPGAGAGDERDSDDRCAGAGRAGARGHLDRRVRSRSRSTPSQQSSIKVGDPVMITLPGQLTTPGQGLLRRHGRDRPSSPIRAAAVARARRRSRSTSHRPIRRRPAGSTRRRSTSRSRPQASATCSWCR